MRMQWIYLVCAILFEVAGTTCMKLSQGLTRLAPSILMVVFYIACFSFLTVAIKKMDVSVAYAIWSGLGIALIACIGIFYFREPVTALRIIGLCAVAGGAVLLCLAETSR